MSDLKPFFIQERTVMVAIILVLLATNILSITSSSFHESLYELLSHFAYKDILKNSPMKKQRQIEVENKKLLKQNKELIAKTRANLFRARSVSQRITKRTLKNVATNVTSVAGEALPYLGAALVISVTVADVKDGCDTVRDIKEILRILEVDSIEDHESEVCGMKVPSIDEVLTNIKYDIDATVSHTKERTTDSAHKLYDALGGTLNEIFK
jgi:hypothetical protein